MQAQELDRLHIGLQKTASRVDIFLISETDGVVAKAYSEKSLKKLQFTDTSNSGIPIPQSYEKLGEVTFDLSPFFSTQALNNSTPENIIFENAYLFTTMSVATKFQEAGAETDDFDIVLRATSNVPAGTPGAGRGGAAPAGGARRPRRRKVTQDIWI